MKAIIVKTVILLVLFVGSYFLLERVDWLKLLRIESITHLSEEKLGDLLWQNILNQHEISSDSTLTNAIDSIFDHVCRANNIDTEKFKIHVVVNDEANAFAMPGNHILIYTGLIAQSENPAELAGVIAHELAHINLKHIEHKLAREIGLSVLIGMTTGTADPGIIQEALKLLASTAFDRESEREADIKAVEYLQQAQIDPEQFVTILLRISDNEFSNLSWISTHPETIKRVDDIRSHIQNSGGE